MTMKELRARQNMTQEQMAETMGVSRITIARIEAGNTTDIKMGFVLRLMEKFGISLDEAVQMLNIQKAGANDP